MLVRYAGDIKHLANPDKCCFKANASNVSIAGDEGGGVLLGGQNDFVVLERTAGTFAGTHTQAYAEVRGHHEAGGLRMGAYQATDQAEQTKQGGGFHEELEVRRMGAHLSKSDHLIT
ncbi:hypothetical protein D3C84_858940 [compost metagenome]